MPDAMVIPGSPSVLYRIVSDHLGSVRMVVKASDGTVVQATAYDAWGVVTSDAASIERVPFGFAGGLRDLDSGGSGGTGLTQMGARWYDPVTGRWITKDPSLFGGGYNLYAYGDDDPVNHIDPSGLVYDTNFDPDLPRPPVGDGGGAPIPGGLMLAGAGMCALDGPAPVGDTLGIPILVTGVIWAAIEQAIPKSKNQSCTEQCLPYLGKGKSFVGKDGHTYVNDLSPWAYWRCYDECTGSK